MQLITYYLTPAADGRTWQLWHYVPHGDTLAYARFHGRDLHGRPIWVLERSTPPAPATPIALDLAYRLINLAPIPA